ncbi:MAG: hypothetical protein NTW18_03485 [Candidatus Omnitrophica bacterium]|nr:hypothetical protein [Candidatus Omnitrophota bacterium]
MRNIKKWSKKEDKRLKNLYFDKKLSILKICKILARTPGSVNQHLSKKFKRNRSLPKIKIPRKITSALARVHAHVCGDGNLFQRREKDAYGYMGIYKPNSYRFRFGVQYTNFNQRLIREFIRDSKSTFGLKPYFRNNCVTVKSKDVWRLMKDLGGGKSREWFISPKIMKAKKEVKKNWIKAFFDDEACFNARGMIRVRSVNRKGIIQLKRMLSEFVPSHITPIRNYYPDHSVYLNINKIDAGKFFSQIGSLRYKK